MSREIVTERACNELVKLPFQLRPGLFVHLMLPREVTSRDVARLTAFLEALVVPQGAVTPPYGKE